MLRFYISGIKFQAPNSKRAKKRRSEGAKERSQLSLIYRKLQLSFRQYSNSKFQLGEEAKEQS
ncbi:hypothetical protein D3A96_04965 [Robertkochia marina]|nr:hypothetical protein D3A96_04965 [Robertkochia marina]